MVQATCNVWISASGVSIYLLHHAARDQRVGAGRADHNHDLGGGSIEDLGLVQGDRWGRPRHRWGLASSRRGPGRLSSGPRPGRRQRWPGPRYPPGVQLCGGPAQGAPWAKAAVDRAWARRGPGRLSSRRRPGRWLRRGPGPGRSVGLAAASAELASSRRGPGRLSSRRWPGRRQRWPGPRYPPQVFNSAVDLPRARLGRRQRSIGPGRAVDQGGSARDVGLGGGSVEDLGMNASTLERIRFAAANRLCVDVGYEGGTCKGWSHTHCARLAAAMLCYMPARPAPPNVLPIELAAFRRLRSQGRRSFRSTPTSCCRRAARVERSGQPNKLAWRAWPHGVAQTVA